jgi:hypothetical protein
MRRPPRGLVDDNRSIHLATVTRNWGTASGEQGTASDFDE